MARTIAGDVVRTIPGIVRACVRSAVSGVLSDAVTVSDYVYRLPDRTHSRDHIDVISPA